MAQKLNKKQMCDSCFELILNPLLDTKVGWFLNPPCTLCDVLLVYELNNHPCHTLHLVSPAKGSSKAKSSLRIQPRDWRRDCEIEWQITTNRTTLKCHFNSYAADTFTSSRHQSYAFPLISFGNHLDGIICSNVLHSWKLNVKHQFLSFVVFPESRIIVNLNKHLLI